MIHTRQKNSVNYPLSFMMIASSDHVTGKTGQTVTVTLSKNSGSFVAASGSVAEVGSGWYALEAKAVDRDTLGNLALHAVSGSAADPTDWLVTIVDYDPFAALAPTAQNVWEYALRTLTSGSNIDLSTIPQIVWEYALRTLTSGSNVGVITAQDVWEYTNRMLTSGSNISGTGATAQQVWEYGNRVLTSGSNISVTVSGSSISAADVWAHSPRTLTSLVLTPMMTSGSHIAVLMGDTLSVSFIGLGSLANRSKLYFTVKEYGTQPDTDSIIQIEETAGLMYIKGVAGTATSGSLVVTNVVTGGVTVSLTAAEMAKIAAGDYFYDIQIVRTVGTPVSTLASGLFTVTTDVTKVTT